ncbi:MAG TPA: YdcF family protein [Terriglobia bacterium]|nr:YdcF family protein [Terriglobia bacterium]
MFLLGLVLLVAAALAERSLYHAIREQAATDEARPADAIVVFGAAQYNGTPSPVFKARLDHAIDLEDRGLAPVVITTGGSGGDPKFTEAGVGRDYLIQQGVAAEKILSEERSETTYQSVQAVAQMLRRRGAKTCLAVSDGFHLYRVKLMFSSQGITAYGSPAPASPIEADPTLRPLHSLRETLINTLWYVGIRG